MEILLDDSFFDFADTLNTLLYHLNYFSKKTTGCANYESLCVGTVFKKGDFIIFTKLIYLYSKKFIINLIILKDLLYLKYDFKLVKDINLIELHLAAICRRLTLL